MSYKYSAALSSSISQVVGRLVAYPCEKVTLRVSDGYLNLPKTDLSTYLPNYLCDISDSSDSSHSSHSSDSSDVIKIKNHCSKKNRLKYLQTKNFTKKNFFHRHKKFHTKKLFFFFTRKLFFNKTI